MSTATAVKTVPQVGDILVASWGYDQTNIDFYKVVKATEKSVWLQQVNSQIVDNSNVGQDKVVPTDSSEYRVRNWDEEADEWGNVNHYITKTHPVNRYKIHSDYSDGYYVRLNSYSFARLWDGKPEAQTAAGYGH